MIDNNRTSDDVDRIYDAGFFAKHARDDRQRSYIAIADVLDYELRPKSVVDFGCGAGWLLHHWKMAQPYLRVRGIELAHAAFTSAHESIRSSLLLSDATSPIDLGEGFDCSMSIEVAEHVPEAGGETLVDNVCRHSLRWVVFSAAPPGQGGRDHINEQPWSYWLPKFTARGFREDEEMTARVTGALKERKVHSWYSNNIRILVSHDVT